MDMLDGFVDYLKVEKRYSPLTVESYRRDVERFLEHLAKARKDEGGVMAGAENGTASACEARREARSPQPASPTIVEAIDPRLVTPDDIRSWIASLRRDEGLKASSVNKMVCSVRAWFRHLLRTKAIQRDPFLKIGFLKTGARLPAYVPQNRMMAVVDHLEQEVEGAFNGAGEANGTESACAARPTAHSPRQAPTDGMERLLHLRNEAIILLLYSTGIRLAELVNITTGDLSDGLKRLKVLGKGDKERVVPLVGPVREKLAEYMEAVKAETGGMAGEADGTASACGPQTAAGENICTIGEKALFLTGKGQPVGRTEIYKLVRKELGDAGVSGKRSPHILRHSFATHMLDNGAGMREIQELLGHSSLGTTQVYTHNSIARLKEVYSTAHPRGEGNKTKS